MATAQSQQQSSGGQSPMGSLKMIPGLGQIGEKIEQAKRMGKNQLKQELQKMAMRVAKQVAQKIATSVVAFLAANPEIVAIIVAIFVVVVLFIIFISAIAGQSNTNGVSAQPGPPPSVYTFVALGDSLTAWPCDPVTFGCVDSNPWGSYRFTGTPWPTYLTTDDPNLKLLHNAGYPAQTTAYMLAQEPGVLSNYHPDVLFILGGTNDLLNGGISEQQTIANLKSIISTAQSSTYGVKKVIILTIPNQCNGYKTSLNTAIKGLSTLAPVIDISSTSSIGLTCADFQSDNLHLTDAGAKKVAAYIDAQVKAQNIFPPPSAQPGPPPSQSPSEVVYCQGREAWSSQPYDSGNVGGTGCVPASMAMILSSYGGTIYNPGQVATMMHDNGWDYGPQSGLAGTNPWRITNAWLNSLGFQRAQTDIVNNWRSDVFLNTNQLQQIKNYTDSGWLMISAANGVNLPTRVNGGHEVVIESADPQANTITIRDPNSPNCRSGKTVTFSASNVGWWLITPVKIK